MPYDAPATDFKAIAGSAKKSPAFQKMAGDEPDADDTGGAEAADLRAAYDAEDAETFAANMLSAIKSCIANYGSKK